MVFVKIKWNGRGVLMKNLAKVVVLACMLVPVACLTACAGKRCCSGTEHHKLEKMKNERVGK